MTTPPDPTRRAAPTVREIAALTTRLRDLTTHGADADPAERAAFLADKQALLDRVTATTVTRAADDVGDLGDLAEQHPAQTPRRPHAMTVPNNDTTPDHPSEIGARAAERAELVARLNTQWPWERSTATELARARADLAAVDPHVDEQTARLQQLHLADLEAQARYSLAVAVTERELVDPARARGRDDLAHMLGADPEARARATHDVTVQWPADHRALLLSRAALDRYDDHTTARSTDHDTRDDDSWSADDRVVAAQLAGALLSEAKHATDPAERAALDAEATRWAEHAAADRDSQQVPEPVTVDMTISRAEATDRLTELGYDQASAHTMIGEYLDDTSRQVGVPVHQWGLDQHDLDAIADAYGWVDHDRGETLAQARDRAAENAAGWAQQSEGVDRDRSPGYTARVDGQAQVWAERARTPEPFTTPPDNHAADDHTDPAGQIIGGGSVATPHPVPTVDDTAGASRVEHRPWTAVGERVARAQEALAELDTRPGHSGGSQLPEQERREQLTRWHANDQTPDQDRDRGEVASDADARGW